MILITRTFILFVISLALLGVSALAQVHRYTDSSGKTHYVDDPAKVPEEYRKQLDNAKPLPEVNRAEFLSEEVQKKINAGAPPPLPPKKLVEIFVTSWCPYCRQLESYLESNNIPYKRYDVEKSTEGKNKHLQLGGGGVPTVKVGSTVIKGFDPSAIERALGR